MTAIEQGPFPSGLDTGASSEGWVSRALAPQLRLPAAGGFRVSDGKTAIGAEGALTLKKDPLPAVEGKVVLAYQPSHGAPRVDILITSVRENAWIDSGAGGTMLLPMAMAKQIPLAGAVILARRQVFYTGVVKSPTVSRGVLLKLAETFDTVYRSVQFVRPAER
ncbi:MAG: hypothetical protein JNM66_11850 [Bryobacterales bacterium]|nr:hypothetical protein [Bryobacterales bacterium]